MRTTSTKASQIRNLKSPALLPLSSDRLSARFFPQLPAAGFVGAGVHHRPGVALGFHRRRRVPHAPHSRVVLAVAVFCSRRGAGLRVRLAVAVDVAVGPRRCRTSSRRGGPNFCPPALGRTPPEAAPRAANQAVSGHDFSHAASRQNPPASAAEVTRVLALYSRLRFRYILQ